MYSFYFKPFNYSDFNTIESTILKPNDWSIVIRDELSFHYIITRTINLTVNFEYAYSFMKQLYKPFCSDEKILKTSRLSAGL